ncbi:hypothetical protein BgiBS90_027188, partial [Biomphalaria glabrata]
KTILSRSFDLYEGVIYVQIDGLNTRRNQDNADLNINRRKGHKLHNRNDKQISGATEDARRDTNLNSATERTPLCTNQPYRVSNTTF